MALEASLIVARYLSSNTDPLRSSVNVARLCKEWCRFLLLNTLMGYAWAQKSMAMMVVAIGRDGATVGENNIYR